MGLEALISPIIKNTAKSLVNFDLAIDPLLDQLQKSCPAKSELDKIIVKKNQMSQALSQTQKGLTTLTDTSSTLEGILTGADIAVRVIKALPVPTSVPPGVGIPLNVINGFTSTLIKLADLIKSGKVTVAQITPATKIMTSSIAKIQDKLSQLDGLLVRCLEEQTLGMTDGEKEAYFTSLGIDLSSPPIIGDGTQNEETLEDRLSANSLNPYIYKGYTIILDTNAGNKFSFPERRVIATNAAGEKIVGPWSYSASTQVLVDSVKFEIDKQEKLALREADALAQAEALRLEANKIQTALLAQTSGSLGTSGTSSTSGTSNTLSTSTTNNYLPFGTPGYVNGHVRFQSGKAWRWLDGSQPKWVEHTISFAPFTEKGINGEERFIRNNNPAPFPRDYYEWNETFYKWVFVRHVENPV